MPLSSDDERGARLRYCVCWPESPPMGSTACQRPALRAVRCAPHDEGGSRRRGSLSTPRHWVLPRHYTGGPGCPRARFPRRREPREDPARRDAPTIVGPARPDATCVNPNVMHNTVEGDALWTSHELFTRLNGPRRDTPGQSRGRKALRTGPMRDVVAGDMGNRLLIRGSRVRSPPGPPWPEPIFMFRGFSGGGNCSKAGVRVAASQTSGAFGASARGLLRRIHETRGGLVMSWPPAVAAPPTNPHPAAGTVSTLTISPGSWP